MNKIDHHSLFTLANSSKVENRERQSSPHKLTDGFLKPIYDEFCAWTGEKQDFYEMKARQFDAQGYNLKQKTIASWVHRWRKRNNISIKYKLREKIIK